MHYRAFKYNIFKYLFLYDINDELYHVEVLSSQNILAAEFLICKQWLILQDAAEVRKNLLIVYWRCSLENYASESTDSKTKFIVDLISWVVSNAVFNDALFYIDYRWPICRKTFKHVALTRFTWLLIVQGFVAHLFRTERKTYNVCFAYYSILAYAQTDKHITTIRRQHIHVQKFTLRNTHTEKCSQLDAHIYTDLFKRVLILSYTHIPIVLLELYRTPIINMFYAYVYHAHTHKCVWQLIHPYLVWQLAGELPYRAQYRRNPRAAYRPPLA